MARRIRISDRMAPRHAAAVRGMLRLGLYAVLGVFFEIASFPIVRVARAIPVLKYLFAFDNRPDPRLAVDGMWQVPWEALFGQTSLWMLPIYAFAALCIEALYRHVLLGKPWFIRAIVYGGVILVLELITGFVVRDVTGYAIWMYHDRGNLWQMTSVYIFPVWMVVGLAVELLYRELMEPHVRTALELVDTKYLPDSTW
jgi:hypothetical protein